MAKLVVLSAGLHGRTHEIVDKTTIGRVEDNSFQIAEPSVSSHHCEVLLRGNDVVVKDLNSTNGTFISGEKISESVLKPGQTLRLGQIELQLLTEGMPVPPPSVAPAPAPGPGPASGPVPAMPTGTPPRKPMEQTAGLPRGVSLDQLSEGSRQTGFDTTSKGFSKKNNQTNRLFIIGAAIIGVVILVVLLFVFNQAKH
jgi:pSer/pThr/pTyr-binding forkhead associated (FHA) protein